MHELVFIPGQAFGLGSPMLRVVGKLAIAQVAFLLGEAFVFILHVIGK